MFVSKRKLFRLFCLATTVLMVVLISVIPVRLALAHLLSPQPQAILTLGGWIERELFTAQFAQSHPNLEIWVSSSTQPDTARDIFRSFGIPDSQVHIDQRAVDTVTNFTTLVDEFQQRQIQHLYLITSAYHLPRAKAIAFVILGSRGIAFTPVIVPAGEPPESGLRILRDILRAIFWVFTGHTGASFHPLFKILW